MKAKKSLGQHFLHSEKALSQIIDAGDIHADDMVLEIGPGRGVLTERLLLLANKVITIEKDRELIPFLQEKFSDALTKTHLDIVEKDILEFDPEILRFYKKSYKLIANIPYYITGAIIEKFLSTNNQPELMVLLVQKEVADRIVARDGKQSIPSIAAHAYAKPSIVAKVPAGAFNPPPKVDSAILVFENISKSFFADCNEGLFFEALKFIFGRKRKQVGGSLGDFLQSKEVALKILMESDINPATRPENLALQEWKRLVQHIQKYKLGVQ